ncbi:MAG: Tol-Pal system protein TolB [Pseudomonadota bacterium]|jgi:TolB protein|nr:Tol-Pal system protein TolB [Pseudomonadota bacterium]QKK05736.1 MAG: Tol-Pal system protein TolB [Pseudomonadota bacterium]
MFRTTRIFAVAILAFAALVLFVSPAQAQLKIDVTSGTVKTIPIAIPPMHGEKQDQAEMGRGIARVIQQNLERTGLFDVSPSALKVQSSAALNQGPDFGGWRATRVQAVVSGMVSQASDGRSRVEFRLWDVFSEKQIAGVAYMTTQDNWRRIAHIISDVIYNRLTGEDGYFDTRIVYISETGPANRRVKRLAIMDQDGANHKYLTDGRYLVLTPRFSPSQQQITYMAYVNDRPRVYIYDIDTGKQEMLGNFPGMTFAPRFSPDGRSVIMSLAKDGTSNIYTMNLRSRKAVQLTRTMGIDTSPSYAPDGKRIVFESDRGGSQQLYVMNANGSGVQRITFGDGRYANPVWSPRGDLIAFTKMHRGRFYIGVIQPDGSGERLITEAHHVEGPTWSPNGRILAYFKERPTGRRGEQRSAKVYTIDLTGFNERVLETPQDGSDPAWSPINP